MLKCSFYRATFNRPLLIQYIYNMSSYAVTGAARGLGLEFVNQLSSNPANTVFALVRDKKTAQRVSDLKRSNVHILQADITNLQELKAAAQEVSKVTGGKLDMLINNGAILDSPTPPYSFDNYSEREALSVEESYNRAFTVNVLGVIHTINVFLPLLKAGQLKKVIAISSAFGDLDVTLEGEFENSVPYSISKAALNMAIGKYAVAYKSDGILFLSIAPGVVNTVVGPPTDDDLRSFYPVLKKMQARYPLFKGPITPEESVKAVLHVIDEATLKDTGKFLSQYGNKEMI